jgi:hypothetical protein
LAVAILNANSFVRGIDKRQLPASRSQLLLLAVR